MILPSCRCGLKYEYEYNYGQKRLVCNNCKNPQNSDRWYNKHSRIIGHSEYNSDSPWRYDICFNCRIVNWHPTSYCHKCGSRLIRIKSTFDELKKTFPNFMGGI